MCQCKLGFGRVNEKYVALLKLYYQLKNENTFSRLINFKMIQSFVRKDLKPRILQTWNAVVMQSANTSSTDAEDL